MRIEELRREMAEPEDRHRVDLRWWLAEGIHCDETLRAEVGAARRLGFGGMEFLAMDEPEADHSRFGWGSAEWTRSSRTVVAETTRRGMAVSFTSGANWSNANVPTITPDQDAAAQELDVLTQTLAPGESRSGPLARVDLTALGRHAMMPGHIGEVTRQRLVAVLAIRQLEPAGDGADRDPFSIRLGLPVADVLDASSVLDLTDRVVREGEDGRDGDGRDEDGSRGASLDWTAPEDGTWLLLTYYQHGTGQTADPSATTNYTVNYLEREGVDAVTAYWDREVLTPELRELISANPRPQMYMDSLELNVNGQGGMFWGRTVAEEFRRRRGYDVTPYLPFLTCAMPFMACSIAYHHEPGEQDRERVAKVRHDYFATLTDLYMENMLRPFRAWLHERGLGLRSEISYGLPFELSRPAGDVDGVETESLEFGSQIDGFRLLAGPAHLLGREYSSETGATTRNHVLPQRFYDQIISTQFAAGVTRTVLHGWSSTAGGPGTTAWPGHEGMYAMFSERFDLRQPASALYPTWNAAMARTQAFLARGVPQVDVAILRRDHLVDNTAGTAFISAEGERILDEDFYALHGMRDRTNQWWQDLGMQDAGWTYEFFDPSLLLREDVRIAHGEIQPDGPAYRAVVLYQEELDADAARVLLEGARGGLPIVLVHGAREVLHVMRGLYRTHECAAIRTPGLDGRDAELAGILDELRALDVVVETDPAGVLDALRGLGVLARAPFTAEDQSVLVRTGRDGDLLTAFAYAFLYESGEESRVELALEGEGTPWRLDPATGRLAEQPGARREDGRTIVPLVLRPGESALIALDLSAPSEPLPPAPAERVLAEVDELDLVLESWDAGERDVLATEPDGSPREVRVATAIRRIEAGTVRPAPWRELEALGPEISGIGTYTAALTVPADLADGARVIIDLGSTAGCLAAVRIDDGPEIGVDTSGCRADVTEHAGPGEHTLTVRVAGALVNRLIARGYYDDVIDLVGQLNGTGETYRVSPRDEGLLGPVRVLALEP